MSSPLAHHRKFLAEFRRNFHTTGAILPSGRYLARALTRQLADLPAPRRILEAGPGTGPVTAELLRQLGPEDRVDLVEWNPAFVELLQERFARDPRFVPHAARCRVIHERVEALDGGGQYDLIVSGLPLNNFAVPVVAEILQAFRRLLRPGGRLSFFEYAAIRRAKALVSGSEQRARLQGVARELDGFLAATAARRELVWRNVPPAWVHHVLLPGGA
ncbi:MAG: methyltransferase domain-containing protein [Planctomycetaceae bacterium]|nr:methyltransferase domain-containing protein [Planctomycetaceae bacterium]